MEARFKRLGSTLTSFGMGMARMGAAVVGATAGLFAPMALAVREASSLAEATNRFNAVFGDMGDSAMGVFTGIAESIGRPKREVLSTAVAFQSFFQGMGVAGSQAAGLSEEMTRLALDFASYHEMTDQEASGRFLSAMSGSSEVMDQFGVNIKQAAIEAKLLERGINFGDASEIDKMMARFEIIRESLGTNGVIGDAERTRDEFANVMKRMRGAALDFAANVGKPLLEPLAQIGIRIEGIVKRAGEWVSENQGLIISVVKVGAVVMAAGAALVAAGLAIAGVGFVFTGIGAIIGTVGTLLVALKAGFLFLISPVGLTIAAVAGIAVAFVTMTDVGRDALRGIMAAFSQMGQFATRVWGGIVDAMAAGDLALAGEVAMAGVMVAWERGTAELRNVWETLRVALHTTWEQLTHGLLVGWEYTVHGIRTAWAGLVNILSSLWADFSAGVLSTWDSITKSVSDKMLDVMGMWDPTLDVDAAKAENARVSEATNQQINQDQRDAKEAADADLGTAVSGADRALQSNVAAIGQAYRDVVAAIDAESAARVAGAQDELDDARTKLDEAMTRAAAASGKMDLPEEMAAKTNKLAATVAEAAKRAEENITSQGTFSTTGIQALQGGRHMDKLVKVAF